MSSHLNPFVPQADIIVGELKMSRHIMEKDVGVFQAKLSIKRKRIFLNTSRRHKLHGAESRVCVAILLGTVSVKQTSGFLT